MCLGWRSRDQERQGDGRHPDQGGVDEERRIARRQGRGADA